MVERELPTKFGLDPCSGFWETSLTDGWWMNGRRTTDSCARTVALLTKLSRAKNAGTTVPKQTLHSDQVLLWPNSTCPQLHCMSYITHTLPIAITETDCKPSWSLINMHYCIKNVMAWPSKVCTPNHSLLNVKLSDIRPEHPGPQIFPNTFKTSPSRPNTYYLYQAGILWQRVAVRARETIFIFVIVFFLKGCVGTCNYPKIAFIDINIINPHTWFIS